MRTPYVSGPMHPRKTKITKRTHRGVKPNGFNQLKLVFLALASALCLVAEQHTIVVDGKSPGRAFEGVGALSAGASSRLLYDYPEPQRSQILDYLFNPGFGASLHHLKVEIGGDVNSTDGSEPSHAVTREEFEHPKEAYFQRGYEWWLMEEAKKRNPKIMIEGLQWGAPGWIGNGKFYSRDNAEFVASFIKGAKNYHGVDMDYVGIWNERHHDVEYIKLLRRVLDENGLQRVKIVASDLWEMQELWDVAKDMEKDPELKKAVAVLNAHVTEAYGYYTTPSVKRLGIPVWDGEVHSYGGNWYAAMGHARQNRAYPTAKITKLISWSLITSYHDFLVVPDSGMMKANTPWSGHYDVQPSLWVLAHFNQFAKLGWKYLDSSCQAWTGESNHEGWSVCAMKAPDTNDYSVIVETMDARENQALTFEVSSDLATGALAVWRSAFKRESFLRLADVTVKKGKFTFVAEPGAIYTLTTTRGQHKGEAATPVPAPSKFPLQYVSAFDAQPVGHPGKFFSDQHGAFEVAPRPDGKGQCLKQLATQQGIRWREDYDFPQTILGDIDWKDYRLSVDVMLPQAGSVKVQGRARGFSWGGKIPFSTYELEWNRDGAWALRAGEKVLASGRTEPLGNKWHTVSLTLNKDLIQTQLDNKKVSELHDATNPNGVIGLGSGWNTALFDNVRIDPVN